MPSYRCKKYITVTAKVAGIIERQEGKNTI
jgi:hypothetical protein